MKVQMKKPLGFRHLNSLTLLNLSPTSTKPIPTNLDHGPPPSSVYIPRTLYIFDLWFGVKCWDSNSIGEEGGRQGGIGVNSDGFLRRRAGGVSTPDLIVMEFRMGCGQMDLASACVLYPLNRLVLSFKMGRGDGKNKQRSGVYQTGVGGGGYNEGRS